LRRKRSRDFHSKALAMITHLTPLEETRAYRDIFSKGEAKGKQEGEAAAKVEMLLRRCFGTVPDWAEQRIASASIAQLDAWLDGSFDADGVTRADRSRRFAAAPVRS
jgi:hypothetical protein